MLTAAPMLPDLAVAKQHSRNSPQLGEKRAIRSPLDRRRPSSALANLVVRASRSDQVRVVPPGTTTASLSPKNRALLRTMSLTSMYGLLVAVGGETPLVFPT